jgi:hypothetical protein
LAKSISAIKLKLITNEADATKNVF